MDTTKPMEASEAFSQYAKACATKGAARGIVHCGDLLTLLKQLCTNLGGVAPVNLPKDIEAVYATALKEDPLFTFSAAGLVRAANAAAMAAGTAEHRLAPSVA